MGKQVTGWVPPKEELVAQEPAAKHADQWSPPSDELVVKKKDNAGLSSGDGTILPAPPVSSGPAAPQPAPSEKPGAKSRYEKRVGSLQKAYQGSFESKISEYALGQQKEYEDLMQKKAEELADIPDGQAQLDAYSKKIEGEANKRIEDYQAEYARTLAAERGPDLNKWAKIYADEYQKEDFDENKITNPLKSLGKAAWNTLRYQLPADLTGATLAMEKLPKDIAGTFDRVVISNLPDRLESLMRGPEDKTDASERTGIKWIDDALDEYVKTSRKLTPEELEERRKSSPAYRQQESRRERMKILLNLKSEGDESSRYLINSLDKAEDFIDYVNWGASALGQAAGQIPAALLTRGGSAVGQEIGVIYMDGVKLIADDKGITPEAVIEQGLDESLYPVIFGTAAGALETIGAKGVGRSLVDSFGKKEIMQSLRDRGLALVKAGALESGTEGAQSVLEQIGGAKASGKSFLEALKDVKADDIIESMAQGLIGGTGLHAAGQAIRPLVQKKPLKQVIKEQVRTIDTSNLETAKQAAAVIKDAVVNETKPEAPVIEPVKPVEETKLTINEPVSETTAVPVEETREPDAVEEPPGESAVADGNAVQPEKTPAAAQSSVTALPDSTAQGTAEASVAGPLSGIKKALVSEEQAAEVEVDRRRDAQVLEQAKASVDSGKINPSSVIDDVLSKDRALQPDEVGALVYYKAQLDNRIRDVNERIAAGEEEAAAELESLNKETDRYHEMAVKTANQQSMAFRLRKMLLDSEYNLQSQVSQYKAANKGVIPPEVQEKYERLDAELKAANQKIEQLQSQQQASETDRMIADIAEQEKKARRKALTAERKQKINTFFDSLKADTSDSGILSASVIPGITLLPHVWNGSVDAVRQAVLAGVDIASAVQAGIDYIKANHQGDFDEDLYRKGMAPLLGKATGESELLKPSVKDGKVSVPQELVRNLVASGISDINSLTDQIHAMLGDVNITKREVRDAITQYGKTASMSQKDIDKQLRQLKRTGRLISQLEDVQEGKRPKRSGLQRDSPSDEERRLRQQVDEEMKNLPPTAEEEAQIWKTALDRVKSRLENQIADLEHQIETGEQPARKQGIQYDQEALDLQAKRDALKELVTEEKGQTDEQRIRNAVRAAEKSIADLERRIKDKDFSRTQQRQTPVTPELAEIRARRDAARQQYEDLKKEQGIAEQERLAVKKKAVQRAAEEYQRRIKDKDFGPRIKPEPVKADTELREAMRERERIKEEFDLEKERARLANRTRSEKLRDLAFDAVNIPKSLLSSLDLSAVLRQGGVLLPSHPRAWAKAFVEMFRQAASEKRYNNFIRDLKASDMWPLIQQSKLFIADNNAKMSAREEQFMSKLARKIPIIGQSIEIGKNFKIPGLDLIGASSRAYSGFLNSLRTQVFAAGADKFDQEGFTPEKNPEQYKALADFINNATGRGKLAGKLENAAPVLNALFFSPRFMASRLNMLNPVYYAKLPPAVRKEALTSVISYIAFVSAIGAVGAAADWWEIELDPRSTDFGKFRIGDYRYDPWGGFQSYVRIIAQLLTGEKKTIDGRLQELNSEKFGSDSRLDVTARFFRGKLAPAPAAAVNLLDGKNVVGEPATLEGEALRMAVPLYMQDMGEIYQQDGSGGVAKTFLPALFGIGVQNYSPKIKTGPSLQERIMKRLENAQGIDKKLQRKQKEIEKIY